MTDKNQKQDNLGFPDLGRSSENDRDLDAALAKYAAVEPRSGLEERILANLRAQQTPHPVPAWWRWGIAFAAAVIVVAAAFAWKSGRPGPPRIVQHPVPTQQIPEQPPTVAAKDDRASVKSASTRAPAASIRHSKVAIAVIVATSNPKLDVFPSPQPLSEQEELLLRYARRDPDRAALLAEARMQSLRQDDEERRHIAEQPDSQE